MAEPATTERDLRIDFFRGLALYMIVFDHIPGDPLSRLSYARFGFSDAAEIFVFLSGLSCGIVYSRVLERKSVAELLRGVGRRTRQIYLYYLLASVATILIIALSRDIVAIPANHQAFIALHEDALAAIRSSIFLVSPPELPGILVLYLELTFFAIPVFLLLAARSGTAALGLSAGLWLLSQVYPDLLPRLADHSYFNPLAWQFLFCLGMFLGKSYGDGSTAFRRMRTRRWIVAAWSIVIAALAYRLAVALVPSFGMDPAALRLSDVTLVLMKENLSPVRLVHFLSVALLVATYLKPGSALFSAPGASLLIQSGRLALQVFCLGAVLSVILNLFVAVEGPYVLGRLVLDCLAIWLVASLVSGLARSHAERRALTGPRATGAAS